MREAIAVVLGGIGYSQARRHPRTGPQWVSLLAIIVGALVFASQAAILLIVS